jgi:hypothetical protein
LILILTGVIVRITVRSEILKVVQDIAANSEQIQKLQENTQETLRLQRLLHEDDLLNQHRQLALEERLKWLADKAGGKKPAQVEPP